MKKKILLVGGCGFIGHNIALNLVEKGFNLKILDGLNVNNLLSFQDSDLENKFLYRSILNSRLDLIENKKIPLYICDARDYHKVSSIIYDYHPDVIIHLAAVSHSNRSNKDPHNTFDHSLRTLENVLDASRSLKKLPHIIFFSSSMIYGNFNNIVVTEETNLQPVGVYGALKHCGELILKSYNQVFGIPFTTIRPSALYGERCVSRRVTQVFIENAIQGKTIQINGNGEDKLDFTYIDDLIQGVLQCINNEKSFNSTFNITYGYGRKIIELVDILREYFPKLKVNFNKKENFVPERGTLSIEKAKKVINYLPKFSLDQGYKKYIEWYLNFYENLMIKKK